MPGTRFITDCRPPALAVWNGMMWATAPDRKHAQVNRLLHTAIDEADYDQVVWMPAHTTEANYGSCFKSNGKRL